MGACHDGFPYPHGSCALTRRLRGRCVQHGSWVSGTRLQDILIHKSMPAGRERHSCVRHPSELPQCTKYNPSCVLRPSEHRLRTKYKHPCVLHPPELRQCTKYSPPVAKENVHDQREVAVNKPGMLVPGNVLASGLPIASTAFRTVFVDVRRAMRRRRALDTTADSRPMGGILRHAAVDIVP